MHNPARRNKNIGTASQGRGCSNRFTIPAPWQTSKLFYERLGRYEKIEKVINGHHFLFIVEHTYVHSLHACSVEQVASIMRQLPVSDYGELKFIIFRQPKRIEELLSPVWGRLIYSYEFEGELHPAIILEAMDYRRKLKWPRKLSLDAQRELARLRSDGHCIKQDRRSFTIDPQVESVRNTQLYRTLPHELGHYAHYLQIVRQSATIDVSNEQYIGENVYASIPYSEKEAFAHKYAEMLRQKLLAAVVI